MSPSDPQIDPLSDPLPESQDNQPEALKDTPPEAAEPEFMAVIRKLEEDANKFRDQWVRAVAEAENIRKRAQRDQEETAKYAISNFARDMVSVLENLRRAAEMIPEEARKGSEMLKTLGQGIDMTVQELMGAFERHGIRRIDPQGQKFDHNLHQAVVQVERNDVPPGTVVQVVQAGYVIQDRLLKPAMVAVSKQGDAAKKVDTSA